MTELVDLYQRLLGISRIGDRDLDRELALWLARNRSWRSNEAFAGDAGVPAFTTSIDAALEFLATALPGWQLHMLHVGVERVDCDICRAGDAAVAAEGFGKSGPIAILSAALAALVEQKL